MTEWTSNADFLRGTIYQARYGKGVKEAPLLAAMYKLMSSNQTLKITKPKHLPVMLLHKKYVLPP